MSTHEVRIVKVGPVTPIEGADSIVLTMIWDYPCVVKRGQFQEGDLAAFIEPDTKVPLNRIEFSFLDTGKGRDFERITTRRFRGQQSYGLLLPAPEGMVEGDNAWDHFGVERYEPPPPRGSLGGPTDAMSGLCETGPEVNAPVYDLENIRKNNSVLVEGEDDVIYSVKIHGQNARYVFDGNDMFCGSRTTWKKRPGKFIKTVTVKDEVTGEEVPKDILAPNSNWWQTLEDNPWIETWCRNNPGKVLYGEVYGTRCQGAQFAYGKPEGVFGFAVFDILVDGKWVDNERLIDDAELMAGIGETVPVVYRGKHNKELLWKLSEESDEKIFPGQKIREGLVVKTPKERIHPKVGRIALKNVSDKYLSMK